MGNRLAAPLGEREGSIMLMRRIIPCLDVKAGRVVKGVQFGGLKDAGCPVELAAAYQAQGADEVVLLDIAATAEARGHALQTVKRVREVLAIPLTIGGGVQTIDDVQALLEAGADKVSVNTAAVENPQLLLETKERFGKQCTVLALDAMQVSSWSWEVVIRSGKQRTNVDAAKWAAEAVALGAGEILLTSWGSRWHTQRL